MPNSFSSEPDVATFSMRNNYLRTYDTGSHLGHEKVEVAETALAIMDFHSQHVLSWTQEAFGNRDWRHGPIQTTALKGIIHAAALLATPSPVTQQMSVHVNPDTIVT